ncbi:T9SS type A sorting domain-containing protein, partial [Kaistella sp.]
SVNRLGAPDVFNNNGTSGAWVAGTTDYVFNLVCSPLLAVGDASNAKFSYYPNPVVDYLNISSSTKVESVSVYNIAGQKMPVSAKLVNGKVDMSKLAPGVYIITTTLDGGKNESFKVVKK